MRLRLWRRREVWLPTIWGWLVLLVVAGAVVFVIGRNLHGFLAPTAPVGARTLVVEGWMGREQHHEAAAVFRSRGYQRLITTGGRIDRWPPGTGVAKTFAEQSANYLRSLGIEREAIVAVPSPEAQHDRTYLSALSVRDWARSAGVALEAIDVISDATHARRSRDLYRLAFGPDVQVGVLATRAYDYDASAWWRSSAGIKHVIEDTVGLVWIKCCFRPPT